MAGMKIISILDHTVRTSREDIMHDFEDALMQIRHEINNLQRAAHKLSEDVKELKRQEGDTPKLND